MECTRVEDCCAAVYFPICMEWGCKVCVCHCDGVVMAKGLGRRVTLEACRCLLPMFETWSWTVFLSQMYISHTHTLLGDVSSYPLQ